MKNQTLIKSSECVGSSNDLTFSKCSQSYKKNRISARSRNFIDALLSQDRNALNNSLKNLNNY